MWFRVGIELPKIEVRYDNLNVEAEAYVGSRGLPTIFNTYANVLEVCSTRTWTRVLFSFSFLFFLKKRRSTPKTSQILANRFRLGSSVIQKTLCCQQASNIYNSPWLGELTRLEDSVRRHVTSNRGSSLEQSLNLNTVKEWILLMPTVHHML